MITRDDVSHSVSMDRLQELVEVHSSVLIESVTYCNGNDIDDTFSESKNDLILYVYGDLNNKLRELYWMVITDLSIKADRTEIERRFRELSRMMDGYKPEETTGESDD